MGKRRRKKARKVFPAKFNASRVHIGQKVDTFRTSVKTGRMPDGAPIEVFRYRARGSTPPNEWLEAKFVDHRNWKTHSRKEGHLRSAEEVAAKLRRKEIREEEEATQILDFLDLYNSNINAELRHTSWKHHHIERFWYKHMYHWDTNRKLRLYMTRSVFFFVEEDIRKGMLRKSLEYASLERAEQVYKNDDIQYVEVFTRPPDQ